VIGYGRELAGEVCLAYFVRLKRYKRSGIWVTMAGCVLRAYGSDAGDDFDVDDFLLTSAFSPCSISHRGQPRHLKSTKINSASGFNLIVSDSGDVSTQIDEATKFLISNREELLRLKTYPKVETVSLDFGWVFPFQHTAAQYRHFSLQFLRECSDLGIEIEISVYAGSEGTCCTDTDPDRAVID
jgi:hypothetical protein